MRFLYLLLLCGLAFSPDLAQAAARPDKSPVEIYRNMSELSMLASELEVTLLKADRSLLSYLLYRESVNLHETENSLRYARELARRADAIAMFDEQLHQFRQLDKEIEQLKLPGRSSGGLQEAWQLYESVLAPMTAGAADALQKLAGLARQAENTALLHAAFDTQYHLARLHLALARYVEGADDRQTDRFEVYLSLLDDSLKTLQTQANNEAESRLLANVAQSAGEMRNILPRLQETMKTFNAEAAAFRWQLEVLIRNANRLGQVLDDSARQAGIDLLIEEHARPPFDGRI